MNIGNLPFDKDFRTSTQCKNGPAGLKKERKVSFRWSSTTCMPLARAALVGRPRY